MLSAVHADDQQLLRRCGGLGRAGVTDIDLLQAIRYYRTDRGHNEHSTNRRLSRGDALLLGFDAYHLVDQLMTQPLQLVLAEHIDGTGFDESARRLWEIAPNPVDRMVIKGTRHYEMYDEPEYVDTAVERLAGFYMRHL
ncbi:alpha/beta hydrolase [Actinoplanes solisilvae]|uniref:alpha/beta hydrolase n=1 Tax=Actinoplanes solisilvae TaxID=2486853 RepID=UPI000FD778B3|nr:alpha/beta hydrolase [Actinoplanes solisilvae]